MTSNAGSPRLVSLNVGAITEVEHNGRMVSTGIYKVPTTETLRAEGVSVGSDQQADPEVHGGYDKAIYVYAAEDYRWWRQELGQPTDLEPGLFGENFTTAGVDVSGAAIGDRWLVGRAEFEVSEPRMPCYKLGIRTGFERIQQRFAKADRPGTYLRIIGEGEVSAGDGIEIRPATGPTITVAEMARIYHRDRAEAGRLLDVDRLSEAWKAWAAEALASTG